MQARNCGDGNLNYHLNSGIYAVNPTDVDNPVNYYGVLLVLNTSQSTGSISNAWIKQIFFPNGLTNKMYVRENINYTASGWQPWKVYTGSSI